MFPALVFLALGAAQIARDAESVYLPRNLYLVRVTTMAVWEEPIIKKTPLNAFNQASLRVVQVVAGPDRLLKREFEAVGENGRPFLGGSRMDFSRDKHVEVLEPGVQGLWWVYEDEKDKTLHPMLKEERVHELCLHFFPYQNTKTRLSFGAPGLRMTHGMKPEELWKEGETFAKAVAEVYAAKTDDDRRVLLERCAATDGSPMAGWAMALLARGPKESAIKFLRGLLNKDKMEAISQTMLDELLCKLDSKEWNGSAERKQLLMRWIDLTGNFILFKYGCERVRAAMPKNLDFRMFKEVVGPLIAQVDKLSKEKVVKMGQLLEQARFSKADKDAGIDFLADVVVTTKSDELKKAAMAALGRLSR